MSLTGRRLNDSIARSQGPWLTIVLLITTSACAFKMDGSYDLRFVNAEARPAEGCVALRYDTKDSTCKAGCVGMTRVCSVALLSTASRGETGDAVSAEVLGSKCPHWTDTSIVRLPGAPVLCSSRFFLTVSPGTREP